MKKRPTRLDNLYNNLVKDIKDGIPGYDCGDTEAADQAIDDLKMVVAAAIKTGRKQVFKYVNDHDFELQHKRAKRSLLEIHEDHDHKQLVKQLEELATRLRNGFPVRYIKTREFNPQQPGEEIDLGAAHNHPHG